MKQRVRVVAIIREEDKILLLKKSGGRIETPISYELPFGKINLGEQPEDTLVRMVNDYLGTAVKVLSLLDVVTFTNLRDSSEIHNLFIIFSVSLYGHKIKLNPDKYRLYRWSYVDELMSVDMGDASRTILEMTEGRGGGEDISRPVPVANHLEAIVYTDGGSRGNPGLSATGYYITKPDGTMIEKGGEFLGITTSSQAEYIGLKYGIERVLGLGVKAVKFKLDNLMIVNQMRGVYQVKNRDLWPLYDEIIQLLDRLDSYSFHHIKREFNNVADSEVNRILDEHVSLTNIR